MVIIMVIIMVCTMVNLTYSILNYYVYNIPRVDIYYITILLYVTTIYIFLTTICVYIYNIPGVGIHPISATGQSPGMFFFAKRSRRGLIWSTTSSCGFEDGGWNDKPRRPDKKMLPRRKEQMNSMIYVYI